MTFAATTDLPTLPNEVIGRILSFNAPSSPSDCWPWLYVMSSVFSKKTFREIFGEGFIVPTELNLYKISFGWSKHQHSLIQWIVSVPWIVTKIQTIKSTSPGQGMLSVGDSAEEIWELVFSSLDKFSGVDTVDVRDNELCSYDFHLKLSQSLPRLKNLTIRGQRPFFGDKSLIGQLGDFSKTPQLRMHSLCLQSCTVRTRVLESFLSHQGANLKVLQLENCGRYDCNVIAEHCSSLEMLSLTNRSNLSAASVYAILKANPGIVDLNISNSSFTGENDLVSTLQETSPQLQKLQSFRASHCRWMDDETLLQLVQLFPSLYTVDVMFTKVTLDGLRCVLEVSPYLGQGDGVVSFGIKQHRDEESNLPRMWRALEEDFPNDNLYLEWVATNASAVLINGRRH